MGGNVKAYWRAAKGSLNLQLYRNASEFAEHGLAVDPENEDLKKLVQFCASKLQTFEKSKKRENVEYSAEEASQMQARVNELQEKLHMVKEQQELRKNEVVMSHMDKCNPEEITFEKIGRVFLRKPLLGLIEGLEGRIAKAKETLPKLQQIKVDLEKRVESAEDDLKCMIQAFKRQFAQKAQQQQQGAV